jgi:hypothetical protein
VLADGGSETGARDGFRFTVPGPEDDPFCKSCTFPALCQGEEKFFSGAFRFTVPGPEDDPFSRVEFCPENDI